MWDAIYFAIGWNSIYGDNGALPSLQHGRNYSVSCALDDFQSNKCSDFNFEREQGHSLTLCIVFCNGQLITFWYGVQFILPLVLEEIQFTVTMVLYQVSNRETINLKLCLGWLSIKQM